MTRCDGCGRLRVTDRQLRRFARRPGRQWWFWLNVRCMGWYDCAAEWLSYPSITRRPNPYERRCLRRVGITSWPEVAR